MYTIERAGETLQIGRDKVFMLLRSGGLRGMKIGRLRRDHSTTRRLHRLGRRMMRTECDICAMRPCRVGGYSDPHGSHHSDGDRLR
ncbi:hypothetical protein ACQPZ8_35715 [Actinomadura nitritigenes]|uniref:hypothetical protein n=1 Tax=Actinomadura nitritigenes TaxID=134602 RepID=UPI003D8FCE62